MKNLLLLLLLANILYFLWTHFTEPPPEPGVAILDETELGPPLSLKDSRDTPEAATSVGAMLSADGNADFAMSTGRSCASIGPFVESSDAERVLNDVRQDDLRANLRSTEEQVFMGHWVQVADIANRTTANAVLQRLIDGGLSDAYLIPMDDGGITISLGLFGELDRAQRVEQQAQALDIDAEITRRMRDGTVFYVDIALPPGRGARDLVERYGAEQVLLRGAATCPGAE